MSKKFKVVTVLGTRPEIIKMSSLLKLLDHYTNHIIVHTGQNYDYELNSVFFSDLELREPDYFLETGGNRFIPTIANILIKIENVLKEVKPDALVVYGDTNSCLSVYVAKRMQIPIFHLEAGNRCFDFRVPEEINRRIVDHLSDVNFVLSEQARQNLLSEGLPASRIFNVGSNMYEVIDQLQEKITKSSIHKELDITEPYYLISIHREENVEKSKHFESIVQNINNLVVETNTYAVWSVHPRIRQKIEQEFADQLSEKIILARPFGLIDYLRLQSDAKCIISDSGTVSEEASILNIPAVTIRSAHERPEGMDQGVFSMASPFENLSTHVKVACDSRSLENMGTPYPNTNNSFKILKIILSNISVIKREVWKEVI
jgi:UDP-N-acetylglucosamine 2-epimerase